MTFELDDNVLEAFWKNVRKTDYCWLWQGHINKWGYGTFSSLGFAHRISYLINKGTIPYKHDVNHICRTRNCVNPDHLNTMTHSDNMKLVHYGQDYINEKEIIPLTPIEECMQYLIEIFFAIGGKQAVKDMIKIRIGGYTELEYSEDIIDGYKKKYFVFFNEALKEYSIPFESVRQYFNL